MCDCPPCPLSPLSPVLAELQQADLITSEECEGLDDSSDVVFIQMGLVTMEHSTRPYCTVSSNGVVGVQSGKSPEVQSKTADVLRRHGFEKESTHLSGKQPQPLIHVPVGCCAVDPSCKGHLKTSIIIVSFPHPVLVYSESVPEPHCLPTWPPEALACTH